MSDERPEPKRVMVTTRKFHTIRGVERNERDAYEVDESEVGNLLAQGMIAPPEATTLPADGPPPSQPVEPMTTENTPAVAPVDPAKPA